MILCLNCVSDITELDKPSPRCGDMGKKGDCLMKIISDLDMNWTQSQLTLYSSTMNSYRFQLDSNVCGCLTADEDKTTEFKVIYIMHIMHG